MGSNEIVSLSFFEDGTIDRDRIVENHLVPDEYFCPICRYLLWKPCSCSSCKQLFCQSCIEKWIKNSSSERQCPFRCVQFREDRCPPLIQSILSRVNIRCKNGSLGCQEILSYDRLEQHEREQCQFLSKTCCECQQNILLSKLTEHQQIEGLCIRSHVKCTVCHNDIEKLSFRNHFHQCCQDKIQQMNEMRRFTRMFGILIYNNEPLNDFTVWVENCRVFNEMYEQQRKMSRLPTNLKDVDSVRKSREQGYNFIYRMLIMIKFLLMNWSKFPFFFTMIFRAFILTIAMLLPLTYALISEWTVKYIFPGIYIIISLSIVVNVGIYKILHLFSDTIILLSLGILACIWGCVGYLPLEMWEMEPSFNRQKLSLWFLCGNMLIVEIILLLIRCYLWITSIYLSTFIFVLINMSLVVKIGRYTGNMNRGMVNV